jgi:hypothetical protein
VPSPIWKHVFIVFSKSTRALRALSIESSGALPGQVARRGMLPFVAGDTRSIIDVGQAPQGLSPAVDTEFRKNPLQMVFDGFRGQAKLPGDGFGRGVS